MTPMPTTDDRPRTARGHRRALPTTGLVAGVGLLALGLAACGGTTTVTTTTSVSSTPSTAAADAAGGVVTVGASPVVVPLVMSNGTKIGTSTVDASGNVKNDITADDPKDDPNGTDVVTRIVDAGGQQLGTITVRADGSVISITGSGSVTTGTGGAPSMTMPSMSMPQMSMPEMSMPEMSMPEMSMPGMPTPPGAQGSDSVNGG